MILKMQTKVVNVTKDDYDVYIGRSSKWGNPYKIGRDGTRAEVISMFEEYLNCNESLLNDLDELEGKVLGCHCKPKACHGDVLINTLRKKRMMELFE